MNILILRSGALGDTIASVPSLWALRKAYPDAFITYVGEAVEGCDKVESSEILKNSGLIDSFDLFSTVKSPVRRALNRYQLLRRLRRTKWDMAISLAEPHWSVKKKRFARLAGARTVLGPEGKGERHPRDAEGKLIRLPHIADTLVNVLRPLSIPLPEPQEGKFDLEFTTAEKNEVGRWLEKIGAGLSPKPWIAVGPFSNMPAKIWPAERFIKVIHSLMKEINVTPFILGGPSEKLAGQKLVRVLDSGYSACGALSVRSSMQLISRCSLYLGNDNGVMHMAAACKVPCVAIFTSRDSPGRWEPYGKGHIVFRKWVSCEGCMLRECRAERMRCILATTVEEVTDACRSLLSN